MLRSVRIPAFAKVNLCLRVLDRRPDNFHELRTIFQAISLHDTLELSLERARTPRQCIALEIALENTLENKGSAIPAGPENLVWRAIEACQRQWEITGGVRA